MLKTPTSKNHSRPIKYLTITEERNEKVTQFTSNYSPWPPTFSFCLRSIKLSFSDRQINRSSVFEAVCVHNTSQIARKSLPLEPQGRIGPLTRPTHSQYDLTDTELELERRLWFGVCKRVSSELGCQ